MSDRVEVHFLGGPADGAVLHMPADEVPERFVCNHPAFPGARYFCEEPAVWEGGRRIASYILPEGSP
jgi:hypothetical protein